MSALVIHETEYASVLHRELAYQQAVFTVLLATTRPKTSRGCDPMLSADEVKEMDLAMQMGLSPEGFAARLVARDKAAAATDTEILERLIAKGEVGPVRKFDTWCYNGQRYPDARSALAAFMERTA